MCMRLDTEGLKDVEVVGEPRDDVTTTVVTEQHAS
jgi:hypothetical protein